MSSHLAYLVLGSNLGNRSTNLTNAKIEISELSETKILKDGWTAVTKDKSLSAQFEHTIGVTKDGCEIFTQSKNEN